MAQGSYNSTMDSIRDTLLARTVALLTLCVFSFVFYINPAAAAVADELTREDKRQARLEAVLERTPERKLSHRLDKLRDKVVHELPRSVEERRSQRGFLAQMKQRVLPDKPLTSSEIRELRKLRRGIAEAYGEARHALEQEVQQGRLESLSAEARQLVQERHSAALQQIRERYQATQAQLDALVTADSAAEQQQALETLSDSLREESFKSRHTPATPEQLPWGIPDAEVREPADHPQALQASLGINPYAHYVQLAQAGDDPDLIARSLANAADQQVQAALAEAIEVQLTPDIRALAAELNHSSPDIYAWVHNHIRYIPSHGSIQGAQHTLETRRGNATDTASLLIALLRASEIPARYAYGTVEMPVEQVMNWVGGVENPDAAQSLLGQGGIPNVGMTQGGQVTHIRMEHVWVEAWVDYFPSRGMKDRGGDTWIPMDASFKQYDFTDGFNLQDAMPFDAEALVDTLQQESTVNEAEGWVQGVPQAAIEQQLEQFQQQLEAYINNQHPDATVGDVLGLQEIRIQPPRPLAAGLPYQRIIASQTFEEVPNSLRHKFRYQLATHYHGYPDAAFIRIEEPTAKLAGTSLALSFKPATAADEDIIQSRLPAPDEDGNIDLSQLPNTLPGYLINLVAELTINGEVVASGPAGTMGTELHETLGVWSPRDRWQTSVNYPTAGQYRAIGLDLQGTNPEQAAHLQQRLEQTKAALEAENTGELELLTKHDLVGDLLYATIFSYFALNNLQDDIAAQTANMVNYRLPSYGTFSTNLQTQYWFGVPRDVSFSGLSMDMDRMANQRVSKTGNREEAVAFQQAAGARMSAMEHLVPEQMFSTEDSQANGISAVKAIAIASAEGQKIWTIDRGNVNLALSQINLNTDTERDIRNAVNAGKIVTTHEARINFHGWIGEGYIILDPKTGAGAYMISGGGNGGELVLDGAEASLFGFLSIQDVVLLLLGLLDAVASTIISVYSGLEALWSLLTGDCTSGSRALTLSIITVVLIVAQLVVFAFMAPLLLALAAGINALILFADIRRRCSV